MRFWFFSLEAKQIK